MKQMIAAAMLAAGLAAYFTLPAAAADQDRTRDRIHRDTNDPAVQREAQQVAERLKNEFGLSRQELQGIEAAVRQHVANGGEEEALRVTLRTAMEIGCRRDCMAEAVGSLNRVRDRTGSEEQARDMVNEALRATVQASGDRATALREHVETRLSERLRQQDQSGTQERSRDQLRERDKDQEMDQDMERQMDRDMEQQMDREHDTTRDRDMERSH